MKDERGSDTDMVTVTEAKLARRQLEVEIELLLSKFTSTYGLNIEDVVLDTIDTITYAETYDTRSVKYRVHVKLVFN